MRYSPPGIRRQAPGCRPLILSCQECGSPCTSAVRAASAFSCPAILLCSDKHQQRPNRTSSKHLGNLDESCLGSTALSQQGQHICEVPDHLSLAAPRRNPLPTNTQLPLQTGRGGWDDLAAAPRSACTKRSNIGTSSSRVACTWLPTSSAGDGRSPNPVPVTQPRVEPQVDCLLLSITRQEGICDSTGKERRTPEREVALAPQE